MTDMICIVINLSLFRNFIAHELEMILSEYVNVKVTTQSVVVVSLLIKRLSNLVFLN